MIIIGSVLVQVCLLSTGCKKPNSSVSNKNQSGIQAKTVVAKHKEFSHLVIQVDALPEHLNPNLFSAEVWSHRIALHNILEPLIRLNNDGSYVPVLAEKTEVQDDGRIYRFKLRSKVQFHDNRPLTSADVKYTLEKIISHNSPDEMLKTQLEDLQEIVEVDPQTVELRLSRRNYLLLAVLAEICILPAHLYRRHGIYNKDLNKTPIGTGPYKISENSSEDSLILQRFDGYWGPRPVIDEIVFKSIKDQSFALSALRNNEVDIIPTLYPGYFPNQISAPRFKQKFRYFRLHPYRMRVLLYNVRRMPLKDRRVRIGITHAINRSELIRASRNGLGQILSTPLWPLEQWYDSTLHPRSFDPHATERLWDAAGWQLQKKKRQRLGHPMNFRILQAKNGSAKEAAYVVSALKNMGADAAVNIADFGFLKVEMRRKRFEIAMIGFAPIPGADLSPWLHSKGVYNYGGYENPIVDSILDAMRYHGSKEERTRLGRELHRALFENPPMTVLYAPVEILVANRRVGGFNDDGCWPLLSKLTLVE